MTTNKRPLSQQPDYVIKQIREFRGKVNQLKIFRAKGFCEICNQPFDVHSLQLVGNPNDDKNIVICCDPCYKRHILNSSTTWKGNIRDLPKLTADEILQSIHMGIKSRERYRIRKYKELNTITKFYGIKFKHKEWSVRIGISFYKKIKGELNV